MNFMVAITRRGVLLVLLTAIGSLSAAGGAGPTEKFLDRFIGTWKAEGQAFGMPARFHMKWEHVLGGHFTQITYRIDMTTAEGKKQSFEGHGYYRPTAEGGYEGRWFDSNGDIHPITASVTDSALTSIWGTPETKQGRSVYRLLSDGGMEVSDSIRAGDGSWRRFNLASFQRE